MEFTWTVSAGQSGQSLKKFLLGLDFSTRHMNKLKLLPDDQGGFFVNGNRARFDLVLQAGDQVLVRYPAEAAHQHLQAYPGDLDILFEDDHLLLVNKPAALLSNPSFKDPETSISNRVLHYYQDQGYEDQVLHVVTRLDRDTSGVMVFAKHRLAHSRLDKILRRKEMDKIYLAACPPSGGLLDDHGYLDFPIARSDRSIIERRVHPSGKSSLTEYWRLDQTQRGDLFKVKLHTGRTHQIRVHFAHVGLPLLGDTLYGSQWNEDFDRQALHCACLVFPHPMTGEEVRVQAPLTEDFQKFLGPRFPKILK